MQEKNHLPEQVLIDSCAFDPNPPEDQAVLEIFKLEQKELLLIGVAHSTEKEIEHPNTPLWKKQKALEFTFTVEVGFSEKERQKLAEIEQVLAGNGNPENIKNDAKHIFEAQKYGAHFITTDGHILKKPFNCKAFALSESLNPLSTFLISIRD